MFTALTPLITMVLYMSMRFFLSYICNFVIGRSILLHLHHNRYDICCPNKAVLSLTIRGMKIDT